MAKKTPVSSETKKKTSAKKKSAAAKKKKATAPSKKALTLREILNLRFEPWKPETLYTMQPDEAYEKGFSAPPMVDPSQQEEAERIRSIIFKKIDLPEPSAQKASALNPPVQTEPEKPGPAIPQKPAKTLTLREILNLRFEPWKPEALYTMQPDEAYEKGFSAPPMVDPSQQEEAERIRSIIFKKIDLPEPSAQKASALNPPVQTEPEKPGPAVKVETAETKPQPQENPPVEPSSPQTHTPLTQETDRPKTSAPEPFAETRTQEQKASTAGLKILAYSLAAVFAVLLIASVMNASRYTLHPTKRSLEIWKGVFSPTGMKRILVLPGAAGPERIEKKYSKKEVTGIAFAYYLQKTDELLSRPGRPDVKGAEDYLDKAAALDLSRSQKKLLKEKIISIKALGSAPGSILKDRQKADEKI